MVIMLPTTVPSFINNTIQSFLLLTSMTATPQLKIWLNPQGFQMQVPREFDNWLSVHDTDTPQISVSVNCIGLDCFCSYNEEGHEQVYAFRRTIGYTGIYCCTEAQRTVCLDYITNKFQEWLKTLPPIDKDHTLPDRAPDVVV